MNYILVKKIAKQYLESMKEEGGNGEGNVCPTLNKTVQELREKSVENSRESSNKYQNIGEYKIQ